MPRAQKCQVHACMFANCGKTFPRGWELRRHAAIHTKENMLECPHCPHTTLQMGNMLQHIVSIHLKEQRHQCTLGNCERRFSDPSSLIRHEKNVHNFNRKQFKQAQKAAAASSAFSPGSFSYESPLSTDDDNTSGDVPPTTPSTTMSMSTLSSPVVPTTSLLLSPMPTTTDIVPMSLDSPTPAPYHYPSEMMMAQALEIQDFFEQVVSSLDIDIPIDPELEA